MKRRTEPIVLSAMAVVVFYWLIVKLCVFFNFNMGWDLFDSVQISTSFLHAKPLFFYNNGGLERFQHLYILLVLLSPLVEVFGVYAFFAVHFLLYLYAIWSVSAVIPQDAQRPAKLVLFALVFLGPVAFWLWNDPGFGWNVELLFLPLSVAFIAALLRKHGYAWLWGISLCLVREDGAVLGAALHLAYVLLSGIGLSTRKRIAMLARALLPWVLFFLGASSVLWIQQGSAVARLNHAAIGLRVALADTSGNHVLSLMLAEVFVLLSGGLSSYLFFRRAPVIVAVYALGITPLCVVTALAAFHYYHLGPSGVLYFGMTFPVRFVVFWSLLCGVLLIACMQPFAAPFIHPLVYVSALALMLFLQVKGLKEIRGFKTTSALASPFSHKKTLLLSTPPLNSKERAFLWCAASKLPKDTPVALNPTMGAPFHRHNIAWPEHADMFSNGAAVVFCDRANRLKFYERCSPLLKESGYISRRVDQLEIRVKPQFITLLMPCFPEP